MNLTKLNSITREFIDCIDKLLSVSKGQHVWLTSVGKMVHSSMNKDIILEDMNLFHKYVKRGDVLDFGAGSGYNATLLAQMGLNIKAIDVDNFAVYGKNIYNKQMVQDQNKLWNKLSKGYKNLEFAHYRNVLPYKKNSFDAVLAHAVLEHVPPKKVPRVLAELHRVLKPKGILYITRLPRVFSWTEYVAKKFGLGCHDKLYGDSEMSKILAKSKFRVIEKQFEEVMPAYPESITNRIYPLLKNLNKILLYTPLRYLSHHLRIVAVVEK
ncbi:MAG: Methyltransferase type 11 [Candidatus Nomurabacteria bacterium GW2011_GWB1_37_5]|uniref:Methyltransferase type 11 n=1 Tax=Candidatus Nomurabacteria bacterium GW2011_GWB1_37_5 TaxID=1618742 RepID=A0A0G0GYP9_9BACT|nr:MAG: Methyltransferase type 11 [Candidatus Nomurabacteria bacterium GW2011_GWB1_37_5]